jgi:hypothetical protein
MKFATCCLLFALAGTTSLAQTHPKQPHPHHRPVIVHKPAQAARRVKEEYTCSLPLEWPQGSTVEAAPNQAYTYVEQMPTLPEVSSMAGIVVTLQRRVLVPPTAPDGRVFVQFVVTTEGQVSQPQVLKGVRADVDSAVVAATRQLPCFVPGKQNGQPVAVRLTLAVAIVEQRP